MTNLGLWVHILWAFFFYPGGYEILRRVLIGQFVSIHYEAMLECCMNLWIFLNQSYKIDRK